MLPGTYDLSLYRGDTTRYKFTLWADQAKTVPLDLTGATVAAQIRDRPDSHDIIVELTCVVTLPNIIDVTVPTDTAGMLKSKGAWDLQLTYPNHDVQTVLYGAVHAVPDVTRLGA